MTTHAPELIVFLDQHWCSVMNARTDQKPLGETPDEAMSTLQDLRKEYLQELYQMSPEQLSSLVVEVANQQDQERPFNRFGTDADFEHYGRCAFLTPFEAVALSLGKNPRIVEWKMVQPYLGNSIFANEYAKRLDLIDRAVVWQELGERFTPLEFLTWAHQYKLSVPQAFVQCTFARGEPIQYWHALCDDLQARLVETTTEMETLHKSFSTAQAENDEETQQTFDDWLIALEEIDRLKIDHDAVVNSLREKLAQTQDQNSALKEQLQKTDLKHGDDDAPSTTERKSLLTLAITCAIDGYGFDPDQKKSPIPKQIADKAPLYGLKISDDTVRKYLKEAAKIQGFTKPNMNS